MPRLVKYDGGQVRVYNPGFVGTVWTPVPYGVCPDGFLAVPERPEAEQRIFDRCEPAVEYVCTAAEWFIGPATSVSLVKHGSFEGFAVAPDHYRDAR